MRSLSHTIGDSLQPFAAPAEVALLFVFARSTLFGVTVVVAAAVRAFCRDVRAKCGANFAPCLPPLPLQSAPHRHCVGPVHLAPCAAGQRVHVKAVQLEGISARLGLGFVLCAVVAALFIAAELALVVTIAAAAYAAAVPVAARPGRSTVLMQPTIQHLVQCWKRTCHLIRVRPVAPCLLTASRFTVAALER